MDDQSFAAGAFKATCLKLMDEVAATGKSITITKRGKPVARLVPVVPEPASARRPFFGALKDITRIVGDIEAPLKYEWGDAAARWDRAHAPLAPRGKSPKRKPRP